MIQANELRIGNLVHHKYIDSNDQLMTSQIRIYSPKIVEEIIKVEKINDYSINEEEYYGEVSSVYNLEQINGIPLTEEWLLSFGFVKNVKGFYHPSTMLYELWKQNLQSNPYIAGRHTQEVFYAFSEGLRYVHQLQNVHFVSTGKELKL